MEEGLKKEDLVRCNKNMKKHGGYEVQIKQRLHGDERRGSKTQRKEYRLFPP